MALGKYAQAIALDQRALAIREKALGPKHPSVATVLTDLAWLHRALGQYAQAEELYKRALTIIENSLGLDNPGLATTLTQLAWLYQLQGRLVQAESLYKRAIEIWEVAPTPDGLGLAQTLNNLANLRTSQRQYAEAEALYTRSLEIRTKVHGPEHRDVAESLNNLGWMYIAQGQNDKAASLYRRALEVQEKTAGWETGKAALMLNNLAWLYNAQGKYAEAEPLFKRALAIREELLGLEHPYVADTLQGLAAVYVNQGHLSRALAAQRRATAISRQRILAARSDDAAAIEARQSEHIYWRHLALLSINPDREPKALITGEAFQVAQLEQATGTAAAVAKMAARFASGNDAMGSLVKRRQDASDRRTREEALLVAASSRPPHSRNSGDEQRLRDSTLRLAQELATIDAEIDSQFPQFQELASPMPLTVSAVQALMRPGEALIVYSIGPKASWLWVIRPNHAAFVPLPIRKGDLAESIRKVRAQVMPNDRGRIGTELDVYGLHKLYQDLLGPALPHLAAATHLMLVPSGPLQSLPFQMLVASPPKGIESSADYREVDWLVKRYALTVLPSVGAIRALREFAVSDVGQEPFAGIGDPQLTDIPGAFRSIRLGPDFPALFRSADVRRDASGQPIVADVRAIKSAPSLPESADELRAMAKILKAGEESLWLRDRATEMSRSRTFFMYPHVPRYSLAGGRIA